MPWWTPQRKFLSLFGQKTWSRWHGWVLISSSGSDWQSLCSSWSDNEMWGSKYLSRSFCGDMDSTLSQGNTLVCVDSLSSSSLISVANDSLVCVLASEMDCSSVRSTNRLHHQPLHSHICLAWLINNFLLYGDLNGFVWEITIMFIVSYMNENIWGFLWSRNFTVLRWSARQPHQWWRWSTKKKDLKSLVNEYSNKEGTFTKENNTHKVWSYLFVFLLFLASLRR